MERELLREREEMEINLLKKRKDEETRRQHELEMKHLELEYIQQAQALPQVVQDQPKAPKLLSSVDGKDDLDAYLWCFERFATTA